MFVRVLICLTLAAAITGCSSNDNNDDASNPVDSADTGSPGDDATGDADASNPSDDTTGDADASNTSGDTTGDADASNPSDDTTSDADASNPSDDTTSGADTTVLEGTWQTPCTAFDDEAYEILNHAFTGNTTESYAELFSDADCVTPVADSTSTTYKGTFVVGDTITTTSGQQAMELDSTIEQFPVLLPNTPMEGHVEEGETLIFQVDHATTYTLTSHTGDADLAVYGYPWAVASFVCESTSHSDPVDTCAQETNGRRWALVTGYTAADFTIQTAGDPLAYEDDYPDTNYEIFMIQDDVLYFSDTTSEYEADRPDTLNLEIGLTRK